jgi:hypothetical protein
LFAAPHASRFASFDQLSLCCPTLRHFRPPRAARATAMPAERVPELRSDSTVITETMYVLAVPDLKRSAAFYWDVFGFDIAEIGDPIPASAISSLMPSTITTLASRTRPRKS